MSVSIPRVGKEEDDSESAAWTGHELRLPTTTHLEMGWTWLMFLI